MTHHTEINKRDGDIVTILNVGRTNNSEIYIDIRVYRHGDRHREVLEIGDITITQAEWDEINNNLKVPQQKLFICPECGDIVTEGDILEELKTGGFGMCMCLFGGGQRTLVRYEPYDPDEQVTPNEMRLIKIIRSLGDD